MIRFQIPKSLRHKETVSLMRSIVRKLEDEGKIDVTDIPQLHRMATAYDIYLTCVETVAEKGMTMTNLKGETVKRPEANLMRESWRQYLDIAREYGFTPRSKKMTGGVAESKELTDADEFFSGK